MHCLLTWDHLIYSDYIVMDLKDASDTDVTLTVILGTLSTISLHLWHQKEVYA